jgi:hypothetical protein
MSMTPEHDAIPGFDRPRACAEDTNGFVRSLMDRNIQYVSGRGPVGRKPNINHAFT